MLQISELKQHKPDELLCLCHLVTPAATQDLQLMLVRFAVGINRDSYAKCGIWPCVSIFFLLCIFLPGVYLVQLLLSALPNTLRWSVLNKPTSASFICL